MADYRLLVPIIKKWEGGFSNHPNDTGGATMAGVTFATYKDYCKRKGLPEPTVEDLKNIPDAQWNEIFKTMYWDRWKADEIRNQSIANILVDWVWGSGIYGIKIPQRVLGVTQDGIVGSKTLKALNDANQRELFDRIKADRILFVENIVNNRPSQSVFLKGWKNRINSFTFQ